MSKNIDDIMREVMKNNKEIHNMDTHISKDISDLKRSIRNLEQKTKTIDEKLDQILEILNTFTIIMGEEDEDALEDYLTEDEEWSPYSDGNQYDYSDDEEESEEN